MPDAENRSRVDKPDYFPRFLEVGRIGEFEYYALQTPRPEGDPNGVTRSQVQVGRSGVGESPVGLQGCIDGDLSEWHSQYRRSCIRPPRNREEVTWTRKPGLGALCVTLLFNAGRFARQAPQVVQAGPPDPTQFYDFEPLKPG